MKMNRAALLGALWLSLAGCPKPEPVYTPPPKRAESSPQIVLMREAASQLMSRPEAGVDEVEVQHLLISFKDGGIPGVGRTLDDAETLAAQMYAKAAGGADFDALVKENTDDQHPGIYTLLMRGAADPDRMVFKRGDMVPGFGEASFRLQVGEVGITLFHPVNSPYGYHIIKRLK